MAVIKIEAKKDARSTQTICLVQGDRRTQILRFNVNRYDGGVDLMDLRWVIKTRNAAGVEDIYEPAAVEIGMTSITVDWLVDGSVTNDSGMADYELNGLDVAEDGEPIVWKGATGTISMRANIGPKFGESDGMTNIEKLILYVDGELQNVIDAGSAAADAAARANRAADNVEDLSGAVERANAAAQRATDAAAAVEDLEGAVTRANSAAALATDGAISADAAASMAYSAATRATEAAKNVENIEEATVAAYDAADDARMAAEVANNAGLPAAMIYGLRVKGETAKASGNPVSFLPDAGSLLQPVTVLEPQQSGSGDPYPAGGGKNLLNNTATTQTVNGVTFTVNADGTVTVDGTATANAVFRIPCNLSVGETYTLSGCPAGGSTSTYFMQIGNFGNDTGSGVTATATENTSSNVALFVFSGYAASNLVFKPMIRLASDTDSTYAPYSNIRPFIGYDKLDLNHAGKNLLRLNDVMASLFEELPDNGVWQKYQFTLAPGTYTFTAKTNTGIHRKDVFVAVLLDAADETVLQINHASLGGHAALNRSNTFTVTEAQAKRVKQIHFYYNRSNDFSRQDGERLTALQIEPGSTASDFTPYQGTLHTVQIGQTVYGIRYEWLTGKAVIEWTMETLKSADASKWTYVTDYGSVSRFNYNNNNVMPSGDVICNTFPPVSIGTSDVEGIAVHGSQRQIILQVKTDRLASKDVDGLSAWLAGTPVQITYKLATPIEIQLTPHIIQAVEPEQNNTLYGDGTIEVEYVKPLHVSIEERVAAALAAAAE